MCIWCPHGNMLGGHQVPSDLSLLLWPFHLASCYCAATNSHSCILHQTQPHVQMLLSFATEWNAYVDGIGTCCIYTWNTIQESQFDNAVSFVVLHISYGGCSYPNYYKWRAKEQCLSSVHSGGGWLCSCCCHTQSWCHTSPSFVDLINCNNNKKGQRSLSTVIKVRIKYIETTDFAKGWLYIQFNGVDIEPKSTCYKKEEWTSINRIYHIMMMYVYCVLGLF